MATDFTETTNNNSITSVNSITDDIPPPPYIGGWKQSQFPRKMCCDLIPKYPQNWPKLFATLIVLKNIMRISGLISDFILGFEAMRFNHDLFNFKKDYSNAISPVLPKVDASIRFWFTFAPGFIVFIFSSCIFKKYLDHCNALACCCSMFCALIWAFGYKVFMILFALYDIWCSYYIFRHSKYIPFDYINSEYNRAKKHIFLFENLVSGWPLWVISLTAFQSLTAENNINYNDSAIILTIIKIISSGISIVVASDQLGIGVTQVKDRFIQCFICKSHPTQPMQLINVKRVIVVDMLPKKCIVCKENVISYESEHVFYCDIDACDTYLCQACGWKMIQTLRVSSNVDYKSVYKVLSGDLKQVYYNQLNKVYNNKWYELHELSKPLISSSSDNDIQQKKWISHTFTSFVCVHLYNIVYIGTTLLMLGVIHPILFTSEYEDDFLLIDSMIFILCSMMLMCLMIILKCIQFIISRKCYKSQKLSLFIRWSANSQFLCYLFGYTIGICSSLWSVGADNPLVTVSLILYCIQLFFMCLLFCGHTCIIFRND
eukprot:101648_1